jgi:signal transduction histidine kinase
MRTHQVDAIIGNRDLMMIRLKRAEDDLETSRNQLRALAAHLLSVRDSERVAIARELHDEFGQALTSLQLGLAWLGRKLPPGPESLKTKVASLLATTTNLIRSVKDITGELRTGALDELGLADTLKSEARDFKGYAGIPCGFRTNTAGVRFDRSAAVAVFRIVQASLTNVARHARASKAMLGLMVRRHDLVVTVKDNGKGIRRVQGGSQESLGISGMRERTLALGGTFTVEGSRGKGTMVRATFPLSRMIIGPARADR